MGFQKGKSGNPGGRPKVVGDVRELARKHTAEALGTLAIIMSDKDQPAAARVSAASAILDRAYGKPAQAITGDDDAPPIKTVLEVMWGGSSGAR